MSAAGNVVSFPLAQKQCYVCNDTTDFHLSPSCRNCKQTYCTKHASVLDQQFCENCLSDISVTESTFVKVEEDYDPKKDEVRTVKTSARQIKYDGPDWAFYQTCFASMADDEMLHQIQIYRAAVGLMENELSQRKINKRTAIRLNGQVVVQKTTDTQVTKTTRVVKKTDAQKALDQLKKLGLTPDQILTLLSKGN